MSTVKPGFAKKALKHFSYKGLTALFLIFSGFF